MRTLVVTITFLLCASSVWANARVTVLMDVLRVDEAVQILRAEGLAHADVLNTEMLDGRGGPFWQSQIEEIYRIEPITEQIRQSIEIGLTSDQVDDAIAFFGTEEGSRIVTLENAARRSMADPDVEQVARANFAQMEGGTDPHFVAIQKFIEVNDLFDRNLSGTMSAYIQFYKGLSDGRYLVQSEAEILAEVWSQQDEIREDTSGWVSAFLLLAYQPLSLDVLEDHVDFASSSAGQALNAALFDGFESVNLDISYALGRAVALNAKGDEI